MVVVAFATLVLVSAMCLQRHLLLEIRYISLKRKQIRGGLLNQNINY